MARSEKTKATQALVSEASTALALDLVEELGEELAEYMVGNCAPEDWQDSPLVEALVRIAALLEVDGREVPCKSWPRSGRPARRGGPSA